MRFILLAFALMGVAFFISNPQAFGVKKKFEFADGGHVVRNETGGANIDFSVIGEFGADMFDMFTADSVDPTPTEVASVENEAVESPQIIDETVMMIAIETPDLNTHAGQMTAISDALQTDPAATAALMQTAMQACLTNETPPQLTNYFVGIVQVVSQTSQLPKAQQAESFAQYSAPLTRDLKSWLQFLPEDQRVTNTQILESWAARPQALVACNHGWLSAR